MHFYSLSKINYLLTLFISFHPISTSEIKMFVVDRHQLIQIYSTSVLMTQLMSQLSCKYFTKSLTPEQTNVYVSGPSLQ